MKNYWSLDVKDVKEFDQIEISIQNNNNTLSMSSTFTPPSIGSNIEVTLNFSV